MMTDKELLDLAAKAPGVDQLIEDACDCRRERWNPLEDDGDALRLAAKLSMRIDICMKIGCAARYGIDLENVIYVGIDSDNDTLKSTRRAIVRAAAEIGAQM